MPTRDWKYFIWPLPASYEKLKFLGSGGSMVARLNLKGIDGRAPPGVEPAASFDATGKLPRSRHSKDSQFHSSFFSRCVMVHGRS